MENEESKPQKQPYEKPTVTKLTREQAMLKLMGHAMMEDEQAKELLDILFEREDQQSQKNRPAASFRLRFDSNEEKQDKDDMKGKKSA